MGITNPMFASRTVEDNPTAIIQVVYTRPPVKQRLNPLEEPNKLVGYYDPTSGTVELFVTSPGGDYYLRVTG